MENLTLAFRRFLLNKRRQRFFKFALPFLGMTIGGVYALQNVQGLRYELKRNRKHLLKTEDAKQGNQRRKPSEEEETKKLLNKDIDNWEIIRGPRDEEDSKSMQMEQRRKLNLIKGEEKTSNNDNNKKKKLEDLRESLATGKEATVKRDGKEFTFRVKLTKPKYKKHPDSNL